MGKNFKASTKLTAKFLVVLMVLQAALFAFTAFGEAAPTSVTINKGATNVSGTTIIGFIGVPLTLVATPNTPVTSTVYKLNYWHSNNATAIPVPTGNLASKTFTPAAIGTGVLLSVFNSVDNTGPTSSVTVNVYQKLKSFTVVPTLKVANVSGNTGLISDSVNLPSDATVSSTTYSIPAGQLAIATVNAASGVVTPLKAGTATVTVLKTLPDGSTLSKTVAVTVTQPVATVVIKKGTIVAPATLGIDATKTINLTGSTTPLDATNKILDWTTSNILWAKVSATGAVYAYPAGIGQTVTITATAKDTTNAASKSVTFTVYNAMVSATLAKSTVGMKIGATKDISAFTTITPSNASHDPISYASNNTAVATVDPSTGLITALTAGVAKITVSITRYDGTKTLPIIVTVSPATATFTLAPTTLAIKQFESKPLTAKFLPANVSFKKVDYVSSSTAVAFVNPRTGVVTGVTPGTATITGTPANGGTASSVTVTVTAAIED